MKKEYKLTDMRLVGRHAMAANHNYLMPLVLQNSALLQAYNERVVVLKKPRNPKQHAQMLRVAGFRGVISERIRARREYE